MAVAAADLKVFVDEGRVSVNTDKVEGAVQINDDVSVQINVGRLAFAAIAVVLWFLVCVVSFLFDRNLNLRSYQRVPDIPWFRSHSPIDRPPALPCSSSSRVAISRSVILKFLSWSPWFSFIRPLFDLCV